MAGDALKNVLARTMALHQQGRIQEATTQYSAILRQDPHNVDALHMLGVAHFQTGQHEKALQLIGQALTIRQDPLVLSNLGLVLNALQRHDEALHRCDQALALKPDYAQAFINRGVALAGLRRFAMALESCDRALALHPDYAEAAYNRGIVLAELGRFGEAMDSYDRALALKPDYAEAHYNRRGVLRGQKRYDEALASGERALRLNASLPDLVGCCLSDKMHCCNWDDLGSAYTNVIAAIDRGERAADPFSILPIPSTPAQQQRCARTYFRGRFPVSTDPLWRGERYLHDRIRIGYFSADFHDHATAHLMAELFERHDRSRFEVIAFSFGPAATDAWRARLEKGFDRFLDVWQNSDCEIAALARELEIDIAVDLKGYTRRARTGVFALRPAPVQVSYLGYPGTMGAPVIDYLIADPTLIPPEHQQYYDEKIAYLPHSYQANDSTKQISESTLGRADHGLPEDAFVFCCFNNNNKITPDVFDVWMRLLHEVKKSVFWLFAGNATAIRNLWVEAERRGIARDRLVFAPRMALADHLARHRAADLFLDTFHFNAHTTASDALWAGLPVLTCLGQAFAGRVAASLLTAIDIPELIARSHDEYESLALNLATHPEHLAAIRQKLAENRSARPLFDTPRFTRHIEQAYLKMYERHQAGSPPGHIVVSA